VKPSQGTGKPETGNRKPAGAGKTGTGLFPAARPIPDSRFPVSRFPERGFTLLEVLVAMGLLAFLSLGIYQVTSSTWDTNTQLNAETTDTTAILLSLQAVESDLERIYTPVLGAYAPKPDDKTEQFWSAPVRADGLRRTRFVGKAESVSFVANNNHRVEADTPQSDFQKITWEIERNPKGTYTLYRSSDWDAFRYEEDRSKKPQRMPLLENLSNAKFTYYNLSNKAWQDTWDSEGPYVKEEQRFPNLIKLKLEAPDPTNPANPLAWEMIVKPLQQLNYLDANARNQLKQRFAE
jgi:type II secretion system protein J